jgi:peptidyl-prolyl cis-trans isomerase C
MRITLLLLATAFAWGQQPQPASADPVVLAVGAEKITKTQFDQIMEQVTSQMPPERRAASVSPQARRQLAEQLAEMMAMAQEARTRKLDQNPDVKIQLAVRADQLLATALYQQLAKEGKPNDAALHAYYDEHKGEWEQVTARHILIRMTGSAVPLREGQKDLSDEDALAKATDLRAKLVAGGDFAALAKAESDDTGSGANGGALGEFTHGRMVPQFEQAAFALPVGEVSLPIKTQFGYHVIVVDKHEAKKFEEVQAEIEQKIQPDLAQKVVDDIKNKTTITFDQDYFGK